MTRLDVFLLLPSASSLSYFASVEFHLACTDLPLVGLEELEAYWQVRNDLSQTRSGLVAETDPQVSCRPAQSEVAFHSTTHLHRRRLSLHL